MHGWILIIEPRVQGNILVDIFQSFWRRKLYFVRFILSISVTSTEEVERKNMVEWIYAAACCTLQTTQGTSATQSEGFSIAWQFSQKKKKKVLQSSSDWNWIHSFNLQRLKRYVFHAKRSMWLSIYPTLLEIIKSSVFERFFSSEL